MSNELNVPEPADEATSAEASSGAESAAPKPRSHRGFNLVGLALTLFVVVAAKSMYGDGNHILAFLVLGMIAIVWVELATINVRDRNYNRRNNLK
jgi:hypothetical protein